MRTFTPWSTVTVVAMLAACCMATASRDVHQFPQSGPLPTDGTLPGVHVKSDDDHAAPRRTAGGFGAQPPPPGADPDIPPFQLQPQWPQPFQSTRNAGQAIVEGPLGPGSCPTDLLPNDINIGHYYHSGVISLDNQRLYVGSSLNVVYIINITTASFTTVDLGGGNRIMGVVASPVVAKWGQPVNGVQQERVYVGSSDTFIYALDPKACQTTSQDGCIVWSTPMKAPVLGPMHQSFKGIDLTVHTNGVLFASTSSNVSDVNANGMLYTLDCNLGDKIASRAAESVDSTETYPIHAAPAIDQCDDSPFNGVVYMPFGHRLVALEPTKLDLVTEAFNITVENDPFQSSVMLGPTCRTMYVVSRARKLWKFNITGDALATMNFTLVWRCSYTLQTQDCCIPPECKSDYADAMPRGYLVGDPTVTNVYATPAYSDFDSTIILPLVAPFLPEPGASAGLYGIDSSTGYAVFRLIDYDNIVFGNGRASAAIDSLGGIYVGSDTTLGDSTMPVMFALDSNFNIRFVALLASSGVTLGAASPILMQTNIEGGGHQAWVVSSGGDKIRSLTQGLLCPTSFLNPLEVCSNNGACNCQTGECACFDNCYIDDACSVFNDCSGHGFCVNGVCDCEVCFGQPSCAPVEMCGDHGTCMSGPTGQEQCKCNGCWGGDDCTEDTCNNSGGNGAVVAVVVIVLILLFAVAVWMLMQWRAGRGFFKPKPNMRRARRVLDVIYETEEEHQAAAQQMGKSYGSTAYTTL